jgi:foldase protein PrsA
MALAAVASPGLLFAQQATRTPRAAAPAQAPAQQQPQGSRPGKVETPHFEERAIPVLPTDPIALVNGEAITRQQLADECVAREGKKILDALVARRLIEQAMRAKKIEVTAAEIDEEIEVTAQRLGNVSREVWLRTLDKERGISPMQYARDIIYPSIALRKLATPRVQVTPKDLKDAMEANFGEKLHARIIMTENQRSAIEIWEELKKNPGSFENLARLRSRDSQTAALGGLVAEPISRHSHPRTVSDSAFRQLIDGDPNDKDPSHKPKDGDFSGPIQVSEVAWVVIKRDKITPARLYDKNDKALQAVLHRQMFDAKMQEAMTDLMNDLMKNAAVDNRLTGRVKEANEEHDPEYLAAQDSKVKLMSGDANAPGKATTAVGEGTVTAPAPTTPAGLSQEVVKEAQQLKQQISK